MREKIVVAVTSSLITAAIIGIVSSIQPGWVVAALGGAKASELETVQAELRSLQTRLEPLAIESSRLHLFNKCFRPRTLVRTRNENFADHLTWVDMHKEVSDQGLVIEDQIDFLAECE